MDHGLESFPVSRHCQRHEAFNIDMCMAFSRPLGNVGGYRLRFSGHFHQGRGWGGFAYGSVMDGAVMFLFYPNRDNIGLTVGLRSTSGHYPPKPSPHQDRLHVSQTFIDYEGYYVADLQCHDCKPKGADDPTNVENWIWSANDYQMVQSDDPGHEIQMHMAYGRFQTVVSAHDNATDTIWQDAFASRVSVNAWGQDSFDHKHSHFQRSAHSAHALLMLVVFLIAFPLGVLSLRHGRKNAFRLHVGIQGATTAVLVIGGLIGVYLAPSHEQSFELICHESVGALVFLMIATQITLGWLHHKKFLATAKRTLYAQWHRPLGYVIILIGILNGALGRTVSTTTWTFAHSIGLVATTLLSWLFLDWVLHKCSRRDQIHGDSAETELMLSPAIMG